MKTKTVQVDGHEFVLAKLSLDDIEQWEAETTRLAKEAKSMSEVHAAQRKACAAALIKAGKTDPTTVGRLDVDGLEELVREVMVFSNMVGGAPGEPAPA